MENYLNSPREWVTNTAHWMMQLIIFVQELKLGGDLANFLDTDTVIAETSYLLHKPLA